MLHDVHDRSFYLSRADASARAAERAPTRDIAAAHLEMKAIYLKYAGMVAPRTVRNG